MEEPCAHRLKGVRSCDARRYGAIHGRTIADLSARVVAQQYIVAGRDAPCANRRRRPVVNASPPLTATGIDDPVSDPVPSWPASFAPQHHAWRSVSIAQL